MLRLISSRLSYANVMATIAVFVALGGGAYAALGKNSVDSKQVAPNAIGSSEIAGSAVTSSKVQNGAIGPADLRRQPVLGSITDGTSNTLFIGESSIGSSDIATAGVTGEDIGDGEVRGADIADGAIGPADLQRQPVLGSITDGTSNTLFLGEGSIGSSDIADGQVRRQDLDPSLGFDCPPGTLYFQGACIEASNRGPATFDAALAACVALGRWLPDAGQLRGFGMRSDVTLAGPPYEWTSFKYLDADFDGGVDASAYRVPTVGEGAAGGIAAEAHPAMYRCVAPALGT